VETLWSDRGWFLKRTQEEDYDASISQVIELRRALDLIEEEPGFDPTRLAYVGHDFGGMYGVLMGAHDGRPTQYVLMAAAPRWPDWYLYYPRLEGEARDAYIRLMAPLDPIAHVGKLAPAPLYFQFAADDFHVPKERAEEFFAAAGEPKEIGWYEAGHGLDDSARLDRAAWLKGHLGL
jgi:dienelactone hydrolase